MILGETGKYPLVTEQEVILHFSLSMRTLTRDLLGKDLVITEVSYG